MEDISNKLFNLIAINGGPYWSRYDENIYTPNGFATIDILNVLADIGFTIKNPIISDTIDFIFKLYDEKSKSFRYAPKSNRLPCINAKILTLLLRLGVNDYRIEEATCKLLKLQQPDGGWRCNTVKIGKSPATDASNPGTTLYVLDLIKESTFVNKDSEQVNKAVIFLLNHWTTRKPLGPCGFGIGTTFQKTEYPFYRYNIFYYSYVLSFFKIAWNDARFHDLIRVLTNKVHDNCISIENIHKRWKDLLYLNINECDLANMKYKLLKGNLP